MKLLQATATLIFAASAMAQSINIATPIPEEALTIGKSFTVEIDQPDSLGPAESVSVVIGLQNCGSTACPSVDGDDILGEILFAGPYNPQRHENFKPPYQNFTFTLDANAQSGNAVIHVAHLFLSGAGPMANLETKNVSVTLAQASSAKFRRSGL